MKSILIKISFLLFFCSPLYANSIYIIQSGSNVDLDITQDGENNEIEGLSGSGSVVYGNDCQMHHIYTNR